MSGNKTVQLVDIDLNGNEIQNGVDQNLGTPPSNPKEGQFYWNTINKEDMIFNGTSWVSRTAQGTTYTEGTGIDISGNVISADTDVLATKSDLSSYIPTSEKGTASGIATLDTSGKVPSSQLPSFVDDVVDAYIVGSTPLAQDWLSKTDGGTALTPETDKIYVILTSGTYQNKTYRWSGTTYVEIGNFTLATESSPGIIEIATSAEVTAGTNDQNAVTPLKLANRISGMPKKITPQNPALTSTNGVCVWTITNTLGTADIIASVKEISSGSEVVTGIEATAGTITIYLNSTSNISADTYRATIIG